MQQVQTETGQEFTDADAALEFIRQCHKTMMDPGTSQVDSLRATTEAFYAFKALDAHLCEGGDLPRDWQAWLSHIRQRDILDMS